MAMRIRYRMRVLLAIGLSLCLYPLKLSAQTRDTVFQVAMTDAITGETTSGLMQNIGQMSHRVQVIVDSRLASLCTVSMAQSTSVYIQGSYDGIKWVPLSNEINGNSSQASVVPLTFDGVGNGVYPRVRILLASVNFNCKATIYYMGSRYTQNVEVKIPLIYTAASSASVIGVAINYLTLVSAYKVYGVYVKNLSGAAIDWSITSRATCGAGSLLATHLSGRVSANEFQSLQYTGQPLFLSQPNSSICFEVSGGALTDVSRTILYDRIVF